MELDVVKDAAAWGDLAAAAPLSQSWVYGAAAEALGARVHRYSKQGGACVQCLERRIGPLRILYAPSGIWGKADGGPMVREILRKRSGLALGVAPAFQGVRLGAVPEIALCNPALPRPKSWRNAVSRAERQRLYVMDHTGCPDWLWQGQVRMARARRYIGLPRRWIDTMEQVVPGTVRSLGAYLDGVPVAGITVLRHGGRWTYQIGWNDVAGRRAGAHNLLLEVAMRRASDAGVQLFDLGMASPDTPGMRRFKLSCGAVTEPAQAIRLIRKARVKAVSKSGLRLLLDSRRHPFN